MAIKHVIIHVVMRNPETGALQKNLRKKENKLNAKEVSSEPLAAKLTNDLRNLFGSSSLSIGEFGVNSNSELVPPFEQALKKYYQSSVNCSNFTELTRSLAEQYFSILTEENLTTVKGGYLVFYQYTARAQEWLAIVILNKTEGIDVNNISLDVEASEILDLNTLHLAASINLTKWLSNDDNRYIRFKAGRATQVRDYFEKFIGCQKDKYAAKVETFQLKEAILSFAKECGFNDTQVSTKVDKAFEFINGKHKDKEPVLLKQLANAVFPEQSEEFSKEAREKYNISEEVSIDRQELRKYTKIFIQSKQFSMSFERELVGKQISIVNNEIRVSNPPEILVNQINEELKSRNSNEKSNS